MICNHNLKIIYKIQKLIIKKKQAIKSNKITKFKINKIKTKVTFNLF